MEGRLDDGKAVWFVTGCSTGFGRELAHVLLERGRRVVVTARNVRSVEELCSAYPDRALALPLDVTDRKQIHEAVARARKHFGRIDVLVNNAGRGYFTSVEEGDESVIRGLFDLNVFGSIWMIQEVLPIMRAQKAGVIVNISSVAGVCGTEGFGFYSSTKHAIEGLSKALHKEVAPLGIHVLAVEPGGFRTDFSGRSMTATGTKIEDYGATVAARHEMVRQRNGKQPGHPRRGAEAIVNVVESKSPPKHLVLGRAGAESVRKEFQEFLKDVDAWERLGNETDQPA